MAPCHGALQLNGGHGEDELQLLLVGQKHGFTPSDGLGVSNCFGVFCFTVRHKSALIFLASNMLNFGLCTLFALHENIHHGGKDNIDNDETSGKYNIVNYESSKIDYKRSPSFAFIIILLHSPIQLRLS